MEAMLPTCEPRGEHALQGPADGPGDNSRQPAREASSRLREKWDLSSDPCRSGYPSDVSDLQWRGIVPLVTRTSPLGRPVQHDLRNVVDALNYRWQTGCSWRMLPHDFPPWPTVYSYFRRWQQQGILRKIRDQVLRPRGPEASPAASSCGRPENAPGL